ncbi:MAG: hypothetical protein GX591_11320 [Planctomycetes bacterium]|nr:hypothetical protein [Planctomycetota bacterium]
MIWKWCVALMTMLISAGAALAADDGFPGGPVNEPKGGWIKWAILAVFLVGVGAVAFKNPKRTHLG